MKKFTKKQIMDFLSIKQTKMAYIDVPIEAHKKMDIIHGLMFENDCQPYVMRDLIFNFGLMSIFELVEEHKIKSFIHLLKLMKTVRNTLYEYVAVSMETSPLLDLNKLKFFLKEFERRKWSHEQIRKFMAFLEEYLPNLMIEKVVLGIEDIENIFKLYESQKFKSRKMNEEPI